MREKFTILVVLFFGLKLTTAQNIGIGTTTPGFPLNFANTIGDKISLWGNSGGHYGLGIQNGLLQIHTDVPSSDIAFGYGSSGSFSEILRIRGSGFVGIGTNNPLARLHIQLGISGYSGGVNPGILMESNNSTYLGFMTPNNSESGVVFGNLANVASGGIIYNNNGNANGLQFRTNGNLNRMVIDNAGRVGIGTLSPDAPLGFPPVLGKKITLYPGATGDVGFGVAGNRLQIFSDNPNADVAIGYDAAGTFNERFAVKPNGALAVNGDMGQAGQMLMSNGGNTSTWQNPTKALYDNTQGWLETSNFTATGYSIVPGLDQNITVPDCKLYIVVKGQVHENGCLTCGDVAFKVDVNIDGTLIDREIVEIGNNENMIFTNGGTIWPVTAGTHEISVAFDGNLFNFNVTGFRLIVMAIPH